LSRREALGDLAVGDHDLDALVAQDSQAPARGLLGRVVGADHDAADTRREDRVGARRGAARVAARLERDVERGVAQIGVAAVGDRIDLGVRAAELLVPALAQHLPSSATTAPTTGLGLTRPEPFAASATASRRCSRSVSEQVSITHQA